MSSLHKALVSLVLVCIKVFRRACMIAVRVMFRSSGTGVIFNPFDSFSYSRISIGNNTFIGKGAVFMASNSSISIGNGVMFGPNVTIMGGGSQHLSNRPLNG